jgi:hypothetical protein
MDKMAGRPARSRLAEGDFVLIGRLLRDYLGPQKSRLAAAALCMIVGAITPPAIAWLVQPAVQYFFIQPSSDMLLYIRLP